MYQIRTDFERPPASLVKRLAEVPTAVLADSMGRQGSLVGIMPLFAGARMAGPALTVKAFPGDNLMIHTAMKVARPGDLLVVDGSGYMGTALVGELLALVAKQRGIVGVVLDGAARDKEALEAMGFPVFCRGTCPNGPLKDSPGSIGTAIACGQVPVNPGDIIIGDDDGVVVVPYGAAEAIAALADIQVEKESSMRERILSGELPFDFLGMDETLKRVGVKLTGKA